MSWEIETHDDYCNPEVPQSTPGLRVRDAAARVRNCRFRLSLSHQSDPLLSGALSELRRCGVGCPQNLRSATRGSPQAATRRRPESAKSDAHEAMLQRAGHPAPRGSESVRMASFESSAWRACGRDSYQ